MSNCATQFEKMVDNFLCSYSVLPNHDIPSQTFVHAKNDGWHLKSTYCTTLAVTCQSYCQEFVVRLSNYCLQLTLPPLYILTEIKFPSNFSTNRKFLTSSSSDELSGVEYKFKIVLDNDCSINNRRNLSLSIHLDCTKFGAKIHQTMENYERILLVLRRWPRQKKVEQFCLKKQKRNNFHAKTNIYSS